jgi:uncharacterized protein
MAGIMVQDELLGEVSIAKTRRLNFVSAVNGHRYALSVALPLQATPGARGRVLYVLDGPMFFATAAEAVRSDPGAADVVVVGIGYPEDADFVAGVLARRSSSQPGHVPSAATARTAHLLERVYDLTLPASEEALAEQRIPGLSELRLGDVGGLDDFLKTLETDIKPRVLEIAALETATAVLFGHSLGGLAVLHALFVEPVAFDSFIAASPAIWWNHEAVLKNEAEFSRAVSAGDVTPRVLITVGAEEDSVPRSIAARLNVDPETLSGVIRGARLIENARELTFRLQALRGVTPYHVADCAIFPKQGHILSAWPALGRAVAFAFSGC